MLSILFGVSSNVVQKRDVDDFSPSLLEVSHLIRCYYLDVATLHSMTMGNRIFMHVAFRSNLRRRFKIIRVDLLCLGEFNSFGLRGLSMWRTVLARTVCCSFA